MVTTTICKVVTMFRNEIREADCGSGWLWRIYSIVNSVNWPSLTTYVYQMSHILPRHMKQASILKRTLIPRSKTRSFPGELSTCRADATSGCSHQVLHRAVTERGLQAAWGGYSGLVRTSEKINYVLSLFFFLNIFDNGSFINICVLWDDAFVYHLCYFSTRYQSRIKDKILYKEYLCLNCLESLA